MTVPRKEPTMIDTPTMTDTAVISAAMAMEVRLRERTMSRGAMRPSTPSSPALSGATRRMASAVTGGASSAAAMSTANNPAKAVSSPPPRSQRSAAPMSVSRAQATTSHGSRRRMRLSSVERRNVLCGAVRAASTAGTSAASTAAPTPTTSPRMSVLAGTLTSWTLTVNQKSLMVWVMRLMTPRPISTPSPKPSSEPTRLSRIASPRMSVKSCPPVAPSIRRTANSGRRWTTLKVTVL